MNASAASVPCPSWVEEIIARYSFRGGPSLWKPEIVPLGRQISGEYLVDVRLWVPHVKSGEIVDLGVAQTLPVWALRGNAEDQAYLRSLIENSLRFLVQHETDEGFCFDGRPVRDPHPGARP